MTGNPKAGDKVEWSSPQGKVKGSVERIVTSETKVKGHVAKATKDDPQVLVHSDRTGAKAVHKPSELKKSK